MSEINLREYYPDYYKEDYFVTVPDEVAEILRESDKKEKAYERKVNRYKAYYSLDGSETLEHHLLLPSALPEDILERKYIKTDLYNALKKLSKKQGRRIYAHFYLGLSVTEIAAAEGVAKSRISESIKKGLKNLAKKYKKF